jgi:hypothetical protein
MMTRIILATLATLILVTTVSPAAAQLDFRVTGVVWTDANCDGIRQDDEELLPGVTVTLRWAGENGVIDATDPDIQQVTPNAGRYGFIWAGRGYAYFLSIRFPDRPAGMTPAPFRQGNDPTRDNDMTIGLLPGTSLWATPVFTIPTDEDAVVRDIDIGLCRVTYNPAHTRYLPLVIRPPLMR